MRFILSSLSRDENMNSRRLHPPETPEERVRPVAAATEMLCTAENASVFGENRGMMVWKFPSSQKTIIQKQKDQIIHI